MVRLQIVNFAFRGVLQHCFLNVYLYACLHAGGFEMQIGKVRGCNLNEEDNDEMMLS